MDIVYVFRHGKFDDLEMRFSLRSVVKHLPAVRKIWIFGDRPRFLAGAPAQIEHVPQGDIAWIGPYETPVTNFFRMIFLASLIPDLANEFVFFSDDFIVLNPVPEDWLKTSYYLEDMSQVSERGDSKWKASLWKTYDLLKELGYSGYNFETHTPTFFKKRWVFDAYREFEEFTSNDRWEGMVGITSILNYAIKHDSPKLTDISKTCVRAGFWGNQPSYQEVVCGTEWHSYLNFDDEAFGAGMRQFLHERFPDPSSFERRS